VELVVGGLLGHGCPVKEGPRPSGWARGPDSYSADRLQHRLAQPAGLSATTMPALSSPRSCRSASPLPPATMAPAWPMRRPGGAVRPAMKPATASSGRASSRRLEELRGFLLGRAADLADHDDRLVSSSARNHSSTSICSVPLIGSPPMPTQVDWPRPMSVVCFTAS
jgi:hypothetical protein